MTPRFLRLWCVAGLFGATLLHAQSYPEAAPPGAEATGRAPSLGGVTTVSDEPVTINLPSADLGTALGLVEQWTGRTVLRPAGLPPVDGINLVIKKPMPPSEALLALETVLSLNQIALIPVGEKFIKVVPLGMARMEAPPLCEGSSLDLPPSGRIMTKIFQLQFMRVDEFNQVASAQILNVNTGAVVMALKANAVMITDTVTNLQRIETLINKLDQPLLAGLMPKFYQLKNGSKASDVVNKMQAILQGSAQLGANTRYSADDRTNQVILVSDPRQYPIFDELIAKLDVKADPNTKNEVIALKHAAAKEVASLLTNLISGQSKNNQNSGPRPIQLPRPPGAQGEPAPQPAGGNTGEAGTNDFSGLVNIQPDERSNSIVVAGTVDDIRLIRELITKVDTILAQVRIEVVIAEVTLNDSDVSGLDSLQLTFGQHGDVTRILNASGIISGLKIEGQSANPLAFIATLQNTGQKSKVKVLSTPMIMTTHAKEGNIVVGTEVPYAGSSQSTPTTASGTNGTPIQQPGTAYQSQASFKKIAIDLKVTPLIGEDGSIQLKVDQQVDDLIGTQDIAGLGAVPLVGTRKATSWVNVQDGHLVVLGGLQRTRDTAGRTKLGFFWEIPGISQLFGKRNKEMERTELLLFIRPTVVAPYNSTADTPRSIDLLSNKDQINGYLNAQQTPPPAVAPAPSAPPPPAPAPSAKSGNPRGAELSRRK